MGKLDSPCVCVSELIAEQFHYSGWKGAGLPAKKLRHVFGMGTALDDDDEDELLARALHHFL